MPGVSALSTFSVREPLGQRRDEAVVDALGDDQARGRGAALPGREIRALHRDVHRGRQVGVVQHHERVLAPHLELELRHARDRLLRDRPAGLHRPGEADRGDVGVVHERVADHRPGAHHEVEHAGRNAGGGEDVGQHPGATRRPLRRLEHDGVAERERRRDLPGRDRDREVPRRDQADDADRLAGDLDVDAGTDRRQLLAGQPQHLAGEELEDVPGAHRLADALGQRLAFLAREQPADLVLAGEDVGADLVEDVGAILDRRRRPGRKRRFAAAMAVFACAASACAYSPMTSLRSDGLRLGRPRRRHHPLAVDVVRKLFGHHV